MRNVGTFSGNSGDTATGIQAQNATVEGVGLVELHASAHLPQVTPRQA